MAEALQPCGGAAQALIYRIDAGDRLSFVNEAWQHAARENAAETLSSGQVLGRPLWSCVTDGTVRALYSQMIARVRDGRTVGFGYRCDLPARRRRFEMTVRPLPDRGVEFASVLTHAEERKPVALLAPDVPRDVERMVRMCSWCHRLAVESGAWLPVEEGVVVLGVLETEALPVITHGICPDCFARVTAALADAR